MQVYFSLQPMYDILLKHQALHRQKAKLGFTVYFNILRCLVVIRHVLANMSQVYFVRMIRTT